MKSFFHKMKNDADESLSRALLIFLTTLHEQRHLGRTAQRLSISVPKASRMLAEAREIFGDPLYTRFGHGLAPTPRAEEVTAQAERVLSAMKQLFAEEAFDPSSMNRVFRIACLDNAIPIMIEPVLERLTLRAPHAGVALIPHSELTLLRLRAGDLDFAIFPAVQLPEDFASVALLKTPYVKVVRAGHPLEEMLRTAGGPDGLPASLIERWPRVQICVHPDTDGVDEGVPGACTIPLKTSDTMIWTEYWLGAVRLMHRTNGVLTLPWRTARALSFDRPLTVLGRAESVPWLEPSLIWHARSMRDVGHEWLRSLFISELRGGMQPLEGDEPFYGRIAGGERIDF